MQRLSLAGKIFSLVGLCLSVALVATSFLLWEVSHVERGYSSLISRELEARDAIRLVQIGLKGEVQAWKNILLRGRVATDLATYTKAFRTEQAGARKALEHVRALVTDPAMVDMLRAFEASHDEHANDYEAALKLFVASGGADTAGADAIVRGKNSASVENLTKASATIEQHVHAAMASQAASVRRVRTITATLIIVAFGTLTALSVLIVRSISRPIRAISGELREGSAHVRANANQFAVAAQGLSESATHQAAALEATSASMEEMAAMTRKTADNAREAATLARQVDQQVSESNRGLEALIVSMGGIQDSSNRVSKIIKTIDEIAFQTNILALNAAVEAARAGDAGLGFAVVADEVRNLAHRSAQASRDTAVLVEQAGLDAREGSTRLQDVTSSIRAITVSVSRVKDLVLEVSEASQQQTQGIDQVTGAITHMEKSTQSNAAGAEESAAASEELSAQAETAMTVIDRLTRVIDGAGAVTYGSAVPHQAVVRATAPTTAVSGPARPRLVVRDGGTRPAEDHATGTFGAS